MSTNFHSTLKTAANKQKVVPPDWMPTGSIRSLMLDDPGEVWLQYHGQPHDLVPDLRSPYSFFNFIIHKAAQFKEQWIKKSAKGAITVCEKSYHVRYVDKLRKTLELMLLEKVPLIVQPALWWAPAKIYGVPDLIVHTSWLQDHFPASFAELQAAGPPDGYVVLEIRLGSGRTKAEREALAAQIRLNTYMLGRLQGWMPSRAFLIARGAVSQPASIEIKSKLSQPLDDDLSAKREHFLEVKLHGDALVPWRDDKVKVNLAQSSEQWESAKALIAWEKTPGGDPRVFPFIGPVQQSELAAKGFANVDEMLQVEPAALPLQELTLAKPEAIPQIRAVLQANRSGIAVLPGPAVIPTTKPFEFFVDYEFFNNLNVDFRKQWPTLGGRAMLFMIGVGWDEQGAWQYQAFVAEKETIGHEKEIIEAFVQFLEARTNGAFTDPAKTALYHWHKNAEPRQSKAAADRHSLPPAHPFRHLPWLDLHETFLQTPCAVPGAWDYGLKSVAKALAKQDPAFDPQWVGSLNDGVRAMLLGWEAYKDNPHKSPEMRILHQYLEADCKALWCILSWMRGDPPGAAFGTPGQPYVGWDNVQKGFSRPGTEQAFVAFNHGKGAFVWLQPVLGDTDGIKNVQHLIWGDEVHILESQGDWRRILSRGTLGWMHKDLLQKERVLEVNFVDVGQGDGCFIVTPQEEYLLIDAGEEDHMYRFLRWRFRHFKQPISFKAMVITHPDLDHYAGFTRFFDPEDEAVENLHFDCIYHNGILKASSKTNIVIAEDKASLPQKLKKLSPQAKYRILLQAALASGRVDDVRMLCAEPSHVPHLPGYEAPPLQIEVLGPVPEGGPGQRRLRFFSSSGKTKNGHSIVLRLVYHDVSILLGGDLNVPAERHLLGHYSGVDKDWWRIKKEEKKKELVDEVVAKATATFRSDIAKACHHGSHDFSNEFLRVIDSIVTVVSSGDAESHCHPRPETLGTLGKYGRGGRPLIYSTELARSSEEKIKHPFLVWQRLKEARKEDRESEFIEELITELGRSVAVYGMITLRTDGTNVVMAQKLEEPRPNGQRWDLTLLSPDAQGHLHYEPEH
jgi:beta-lactamase superfamily II metal-dependent hydrolase